MDVSKLAPFAKAVAAAAAALGVIATALGTIGNAVIDGKVTPEEINTIALALGGVASAVGGVIAVYSVPNRKPVQ